MSRLFLALALLFPPAVSEAAGGRAPVVDPTARAAAARVSSLADTDPVARLNMVLEAAKLDEASLFALAGTHPSIVEHLTDPHIKATVDYIRALPATELHKLRRGETVIRDFEHLRADEKKRALRLAERMNFPKYKEKKLRSIRLGPLEARIFRVEITYQHRKTKLFSEDIELCWPSTPEREEGTRDRLAKHFGARPSRASGSTGTPLPLEDGSFEEEGTLGGRWDLGEGVVLGTELPVAEVAIDESVALDGTHSVRFHATEKTRRFPEVLQHVPVQPGTPTRVRAQFRADNLRVEYQQREDQVGLSLTWVDAMGNPVAAPLVAHGRLTSHPWELLELNSVAPASATMARVGLMSAVSGTAWFDGITVAVGD
ncbi:MAG: hypothetical protein VX265_17770 [Myxococcota bacterium]|nr:hypothetical protein [Myxococcota bacterium]